MEGGKSTARNFSSSSLQDAEPLIIQLVWVSPYGSRVDGPTISVAATGAERRGDTTIRTSRRQ
jgi:hypothetical protein